ncbi:MAG TPA: putative LPS assembly protein LptD [Bryobacteraceae bacterium]|nr:putative LPS assembly protein LptD [Bryobacteraceae bacterium]
MFFLALALFFVAHIASGQTSTRPLKANLPPADEIWMKGIVNESDNEWRHLKGSAHLETSEMQISADEIDYNSDTAWAYARGHVQMEQFSTGDKLNADHGEYNLQTEEGKFYVVDGTAPAKILTSPAVLTTTNPFYYQAQWAERIKNRYILHHGFVTDCKMPKPWWSFQAPVFDIIPGDRAMARHALFRIHRVPIFYLPWFYRPLGRSPRQSGFLTPNFGHTSTRGYMYGAGYYWAINRSYDVDGLMQYFTARGPAESIEVRGKPNEVSDFDFNLYSVQDLQGYEYSPTNIEKQGGTEFELTARTQIFGFNGRLDYNYLSSYLFRQAFSYSFATAISSEIDSVGYLQRHFKDDLYTLNFVLQRTQLFESITELTQAPNQVILQQFPSVEFLGRDQQIGSGPLPLYFSFGSTAGLLERSEPIEYETLGLPKTPSSSGGVARVDLEPRVMTDFSFAGFSLSPAVTLGVTDYSNSYSTNYETYGPIVPCSYYSACPPNPTVFVKLANSNLFRKDADFTLDFRTPSLEKIYTPPKWLHLGTKLKHVIEAEATYEYVTGINEFDKIIHFDATDIISNTNQLTIWLTNRLYKKDSAGNVSEFLTWRLGQQRYFDPTFGGAVLPGVRNVVLASEEFSPYAFLDGPRAYSPIVSSMSISPYSFINVEWRVEYDPLRHKIIDDAFTVNVRRGLYYAGIGDTAITTSPLLVPQANQVNFGGGYGSTNRKGWNIGAVVDRDLLAGRNLYEFIQSSYNTNCCGFSVQLRRFNIGIRDENEWLFSFSVANIGSFGSLQKQGRIQ